MRLIILTILIIFSFGCGNTANNNANSANTSRTDFTKLPSGREIKINGIGRMDFKDGSSALVMNYETKIPIEDMENLRKEVDEVWSIFQKDVEREKLNHGILRPSHYEGEGIIRNGKGYGFVYEKGADGKWHLLEDEKKKQ